MDRYTLSGSRKPEPERLYRTAEYLIEGSDMSGCILVAYASKNGSTAEIAQAIGKELQATGKNADVVEMKTVKALAGYDAVVLGAPLYMGSVMGDMGKFVGRHRDELAIIPVAAFVVGIAPKDPKPGAIETAMGALVKALGPVTPVASVLFAGKLDPAKVNFVMRKFMEMAKIPTGDFRDWDAITAWARGLPAVLKV
jgi:menaquinone-dependent protoporphyrinogen oxidase